MTGFDYAKTRATAKRLLTKFGRSVVLSRAGVLVGPAWAASPGGTEEFPVTVAVIKEGMAPSPDGASSRLTKTLLMEAPDLLTPAKGNVVRVDTTAFEVVEVRPLAPGGIDVLFEVDVIA